GPGKAGHQAFESAGLPTANLTLEGFGWQTLLRLNRLVGQYRIQLVHWHFYPPVLNSYLWALSVLRPWVQHCFTDHNSRLLPLPSPPRGVTRWLKWLLLKRYRKVWCVSQFVRDCMVRQGIWSNVDCCLHFVNTDRFRPEAKVREQVRREL